MTETLASFAGWDVKTVKLFHRYLLEFSLIPNHRKILRTMIDYAKMYPELHHYGRVDPYGALEKENEYRQLARARYYLLNKDLLSTYDPQGGRILTVTRGGQRIYYESYPLAKLSKERWNGEWLMVMYDFPEKMRVERNRLREKLLTLGFGQPQLSSLISPLPLGRLIQQYIKDESLNDFVWVISAKHVSGLSNREIAAKAWRLGEHANLYAKLLEIFPKLEKINDRRHLTEWLKYFFALDSQNPHLPIELLPAGWPAKECRKLAAKLERSNLLRALFT